MRVAVLQETGDPDDPRANAAVLERAVADAAGQGADVLVTPELFGPGYAPERVYAHDGADHRRAAAELSARHRIHLVVCTVEHAGAARHITATLTGPDGAVLLEHRKAHLFGAEAEVFTPGDHRSAVVRIAGTAVALGICFDVEFGDYVRSLAADGADLILCPTAVPAAASGYDAHRVAEHTIPTRAMESTIAIAYANHTAPAFTGSSVIAAANGEDLARASRDRPELIIADVTAADVADARAALPYLRARRPEVYRSG